MVQIWTGLTINHNNNKAKYFEICCFWFESWLLPFFISVVRRFWRQWSSCHFPTESTACGTDCINWFNLYNFGHFDRKVRIIQKNMNIVKKMLQIKIHIFWEGHKILRNLHCRIDRYYIGQIYCGDFAKFCGLLRTYEL